MQQVENRGIAPSTRIPSLREYASWPDWESFQGLLFCSDVATSLFMVFI
jgi:hypothetical protein